MTLRTLEEKNLLFYISHILGWIYFISWSLGFYGQLIENYLRKSVSGLNFDLEIYNFFGFATYAIYNIRGYLNENLGTGIVEIQDIVYPVHCLFITALRIFQILYYFDPKDKLQKISNFAITIIFALAWGALLLILLENFFEYYSPEVKEDDKYVFNSLIYMGWCKIIITVIKFFPQVISNFKRKSTIGWNIHGTWLDFTGCIFALSQTILDSFRDDISSTSKGKEKGLNLAKYGLSLFSLFFDIIFIVQHYILYKDSNSDLKKKKIYKIETNNEKLINSYRESDVKNNI